MNASPRQNELFLNRGLFCLMIVFFACAAGALLECGGWDPLIFLPCGRGVSPSGEVWDACAARDFAREARINSLFLPPCGRGVSPSGEVWDACAARVFTS